MVPVVSSAHLAAGPMPELSEFEFGLIVSGHAFGRWVTRAMAAAGHPELGELDTLILHTVRHRDRPKKLADICLTLNIEDTHTVAYAIKKLTRSGLVESARAGKEKTVSATDAGVAACERYREIRERLLLSALSEMGIEPEQLSRLSAMLRLMSGQYDQATRAATTL